MRRGRPVRHTRSLGNEGRRAIHELAQTGQFAGGTFVDCFPCFDGVALQGEVGEISTFRVNGPIDQSRSSGVV